MQNNKKIFDEYNYKEKYYKYKKKYFFLKNKEIENFINMSGGGENIWIENEFFDEDKFKFIENYSKSLINKLNEDERVTDRKTLCLDPKKHEKLYEAIYDDEKFQNYIKQISTQKFRIRPTFPIELRKYPTGSKGMGWHIDTSLFDPDCFEIVLTLENTSDSTFVYDYYKKNTIYPKSNTMAIVRPGSVLHKVTPINYGYRTILKFVVEFLDENNTNRQKDNFKKELKKCPF